MKTQQSHPVSSEVTSVGFTVALRILDRWGCSNEQVQSILQMPKSSFYKAKSAPDSLRLSPDQLERISYILNIHQGLRLVFDNPENVYGFMQMSNQNAYFNGKKPLDIIAQGDFASLYEVYKRVDALRGAGL